MGPGCPSRRSRTTWSCTCRTRARRASTSASATAGRCASRPATGSSTRHAPPHPACSRCAAGDAHVDRLRWPHARVPERAGRGHVRAGACACLTCPPARLHGVPGGSLAASQQHHSMQHQCRVAARNTGITEASTPPVHPCSRLGGARRAGQLCQLHLHHQGRHPCHLHRGPDCQVCHSCVAQPLWGGQLLAAAQHTCSPLRGTLRHPAAWPAPVLCPAGPAAADAAADGVRSDAWCRSLADTLTKKNKTSNVKAFMVKNYLSVFVNAMIENPAFDSQAPPLLLQAWSAALPMIPGPGCWTAVSGAVDPTLACPLHGLQAAGSWT